MTASYGTATVECGGAQIRAHCRHLATVVTITGDVDAVNTEAIGVYVRRLLLLKNALILDLSGVSSFAATGIPLLSAIDEDCRAAALEWAVVASRPVMELLDDHRYAAFPVARSVPEALSVLAEEISTRRELLLPLIRKTA